MNDYKITEAGKKKEYEGINIFLLANKEKNGLYKDENGIVELEFEQDELLSSNFINGKHKKNFKLSLREIGEKLLKLDDSADDKVKKHLIKPEMEIERVFNSARFKYLQCICDSDIKNPSRLISSEYNNAFQSLAGITVYQGNTLIRRENDDFWREAEFTLEAKNKNSFESELKDLNFIILYLRNLNLSEYNKIYAELIAIKPGFHEIFIHSNYFDENDKYKTNPNYDDKPRDKVFKLLRGYGDISDINLEKLKPHEINRKNYFSYSSCTITEGPFVFRKKRDISYYDEIKKIQNITDKQSLDSNFNIYNYFEKKPFTQEKLEIILKESERFKNYIHE